MKNITSLIDNIGPKFIKQFGDLLNPFILNFRDEKKQLLIFYFHGLYETKAQQELNHIDPQTNITVHQFVEFIEYFLQHNYKFILPEDIPSISGQEQPLAMITFDDGYYNNKLAIDILNKYKIPGVFFISTRNIIETKAYWWDIIYRNRKKENASIEAIRKEQTFLKGYKYSYIENYIIENFGEKAFVPWSDIDRPFTKQEIIDLSTNPLVQFGNHTHNHSILTNYNKEEIIKELTTSNNIINELTGKKPISIAFPNGNYNDLVLEVSNKLGLIYGFTTDQGRNLLPITSDKLICLKRFITNPDKIINKGGFYRLNYEPVNYYFSFKSKTKQLFTR